MSPVMTGLPRMEGILAKLRIAKGGGFG